MPTKSCVIDCWPCPASFCWPACRGVNANTTPVLSCHFGLTDMLACSDAPCGYEAVWLLLQEEERRLAQVQALVGDLSKREGQTRNELSARQLRARELQAEISSAQALRRNVILGQRHLDELVGCPCSCMPPCHQHSARRISRLNGTSTSQ